MKLVRFSLLPVLDELLGLRLCTAIVNKDNFVAGVGGFVKDGVEALAENVGLITGGDDDADFARFGDLVANGVVAGDLRVGDDGSGFSPAF